MPVIRALTRPIIRTPEHGADTIIWLGAAPGSKPSSTPGEVGKRIIRGVL